MEVQVDFREWLGPNRHFSTSSSFELNAVVAATANKSDEQNMKFYVRAFSSSYCCDRLSCRASEPRVP